MPYAKFDRRLTNPLKFGYDPDQYPMEMPACPENEEEVQGWLKKCDALEQGNRNELGLRMAQVRKVARIVTNSKEFMFRNLHCMRYTYENPPTYAEAMNLRDGLSIEQYKKLSRETKIKNSRGTQTTLDAIWKLNPKKKSDVYDLLYGNLTISRMDYCLNDSPLTIPEDIECELVDTVEKKKQMIEYLNSRIYFKYKYEQLKQCPQTIWFLIKILYLILTHRNSVDDKLIEIANMSLCMKHAKSYQRDICVKTLQYYKNTYCDKD